MSYNIEESINERVNSQLYSDVISSYVDINSVTAQRNIIPGSYKETVVQCTDQTLATLNSAGGQTLFTRLKLTPQVRNATLAQLAQIYFQYIIPGGDKDHASLGVIVKKYSANNTAENYSSDSGEDIKTNPITEKLRFKLFYDTGFSIASMVQLCLVADAKVSTENFNYQQSLLTLNSLPDTVTDNSNCESTLRALVDNPGFKGIGSGLIEVSLNRSAAAGKRTVARIEQDICVEGVIDLDRGNPLFHNFPIITRNMGEMYLRLYMENFLRELKVVYLNKSRQVGAFTVGGTGMTATLKLTGGASYSQTTTYTLSSDAGNTIGGIASGPRFEYLPYARIPADKPDFIYLDGELYKVKLVNIRQNNIDTDGTADVKFDQTNPIYTLNNIRWTRFEIRKQEFDIEEYEDIKASQAKSGTYKFPVHIFRSKNFDQTNAASSSSNALQTTLNAPNIDRMFITQPYSRDYYTFLPTITATDMNPQLHNNPVLPRTEDALNTRTIERIAAVYTDTDKYTPSSDLYNSLNIPTIGKKIWLKDNDTYGGAGAIEKLQRGINVMNQPTYLPNKFAYGLELNEGGCFRRGYNSVIDGNYSPTVPCNMQQSTQTSADIYFSSTYDAGANADDVTINSNHGFNAVASYGSFSKSGAVASVHCLCDYIFWINFDQYGMMTDFGVSEYNDRN